MKSRRPMKLGKGRVLFVPRLRLKNLKGGKEQIVITEIPYEINKANLVKKIDDVRVNK